jgi:hypothetical protein
MGTMRKRLPHPVAILPLIDGYRAVQKKECGEYRAGIVVAINYKAVTICYFLI